ncbi:MAG: exodeoxyribonuclease VII small subunit, partial [Acidimicrobiales bacterium]
MSGEWGRAGFSGGPGGGASGEDGVDSARSFEELVAELESLTDRLAGGQIGIEEAAQVYARAELLHSLAGARLAAVQE